MTLNVRVSGKAGDFVAINVGEEGDYENVSEYVRDVIRRDKQQHEAVASGRLKADLARAFAVREAEYDPLTADQFIARNRARAGQ